MQRVQNCKSRIIRLYFSHSARAKAICQSHRTFYTFRILIFDFASSLRRRRRVVNFSGHTSANPSLSLARAAETTTSPRISGRIISSPIVKLSYRTAILPKPPDFSCGQSRTAVFQTVRDGGTAKRRNVSGSLGMQGEG